MTIKTSIRTSLLIVLVAGGLLNAGFAIPILRLPMTAPPLWLDWSVKGSQSGAEFGAVASSAGDVNGDGFDDLAVGSPVYTAQVDNEGAVFVYYGGPTGLSASPDAVLRSAGKGARFGAAVSSAGDVNGDGFDDLIVGAPHYKEGQYQTGAAFLFYGSAGGVVTHTTAFFTGAHKDAEFGVAVAAGGDLNGDTFDDVLVGADLQEDTQGHSVGAAYAFFGSADGLITATHWLTTGRQTGARFGAALNGVGDINADGFDDFAIGAPYFSGTQANAGQVTVFTGTASGPTTTAAHTLPGSQSDAQFGGAISAGADWNADDFDDFAIGAPYFDCPQADEGAFFIVYGDETGLQPAPAPVCGGQADARLGQAIAPAGDVDADGFDDLIAGAPGYQNGQSAEGGAFIFRGSAGGVTPFAGWQVEGNKANALFGATVAGCGHTGDNARPGVVVGAPDFRSDDRLILGWVFAYHAESAPFEPVTVYLPCVIKSN